MAITQGHLSIEQIKDDIVILKDGSMALVLQTTAVNFGLLSENEQLAIISAFAALLNSLSFAIQLIIRSKRLDITSYLNLLAEAQKTQTNSLLARLIANYRDFIEKIVRENQVLDKQFYIVIPLSYLEVGLTKNVEGHFKKSLTILLPRRDHIIRQLWRTGLKASQLNTKQLIELFYDIYNSPRIGTSVEPMKEEKALQKTAPVVSTENVTAPIIEPEIQKPVIPEKPVSQPPIQASPAQMPIQPRSAPATTPFVVEELTDEYGTV